MTASRSLVVALLLVGPALLAAPAAAQDQPSGSALQWFHQFDGDDDDVMTPDEMARIAAKVHRRTDADGDGDLSVEEYLFGIPEDLENEVERFRRRFSIMDADGDGGATEGEFIAFGHRVIATADRDGDGGMSLEEFTDSVTK